MIERGVYTYIVAPRDVDFSRQATIVSLGDYVLDVAGKDADKNGFGIRNLSASNSSWVLSRVAIEMERIPMQYETITITTWVSNVGRLMTTRNMILSDERGERIGAAVTCWAMIDLSSRRPLDLSAHPDYLAAVIDEPSPIDAPCKVARIQPQNTANHTVVYSDIDFNRHANSMKYVEWVVDMLPEQYHAERRLERMEINYTHESRWGDELTIGAQLNESSLFEIRNAEGIEVCRIAIQWH